MEKTNLAELNKLIDSSKSILIFPHEDPDADCLGSACALALLLKSLNKEVQIIESDLVPDIIASELIGKELISTEAKELAPDLIIIVDTSNIEEMAPNSYNKYIKNFKGPIINIDHHISNKYFGTINIVDTVASATGELLTFLFKDLNYNINSDIAFDLLLGIIFDSQNFKVPSTTYKTLLAASYNVELGANIQRIISLYNPPHTIEQALTMAHLVSNMQTTEDKKIGWICISNSQKEDTDFDTYTKGIVGYIASLKGIEIALKFSEERIENRTNIKISFRSKNVDISTIAERHNGGGHKNAAGCILLDTTLEQAEKIIVDECKEVLKSM